MLLCSYLAHAPFHLYRFFSSPIMILLPCAQSHRCLMGPLLQLSQPQRETYLKTSMWQLLEFTPTSTKSRGAGGNYKSTPPPPSMVGRTKESHLQDQFADSQRIPVTCGVFHNLSAYCGGLSDSEVLGKNDSEAQHYHSVHLVQLPVLLLQSCFHF